MSVKHNARCAINHVELVLNYLWAYLLDGRQRTPEECRAWMDRTSKYDQVGNDGWRTTMVCAIGTQRHTQQNGAGLCTVETDCQASIRDT